MKYWFKFLTLFLLLQGLSLLRAQAFNHSWYVQGQPYLKITVNQDGVYRITGQQLASNGVVLSSLNSQTLKLFENGQEIPIWISGGATLSTTDYIEFIGKRNTGADESWAYDHPTSQSSKEFSLFTDKTVYWLTYGGSSFGLRYQALSPSFYNAGATPNSTSNQEVHIETEAAGYHSGDGEVQTGNPLYTRAEGFFMNLLTNTSSSNVEVVHNIPLSLPSSATTDSVRVTLRLSSANATRHKVGLKALINTGSGATNVELKVVEWVGYGYGDIQVAIPQSQLVSTTSLQLTVSSYNDFNADRPGVYVDYIRTKYTRTAMAVTNNLVWDSEVGRHLYNIGGMGSGVAYVLDSAHRRRFEITTAGGVAQFSNDLTVQAKQYLFQDAQVKTPLSVVQDVSVDLANLSNEADYLIITTDLLKPSAQQLANYRQMKDGYKTYIADVQDIFDLFDYGRPTPVAMRRFIQQTQNWAVKPRFLILWGDTFYPARNVDLQPWEVPSFGRPSSDGWFVIQANGERDFTEKLAVGRINIRTNAEGIDIFIPKLQAYENNLPAYWQKSVIGLSGGTNSFEQQILGGYMKDWVRMLETGATGMNSYNISKSTTAVLDPSLLDSLQVQIAEGSPLMMYFGHSSAFTWEFVTKPFAEWNNAHRLPIVFSLGCYTGVFAGDLTNLNRQVFAEELVLGSQTGGIAHWGGSAASYINYTADMVNHVVPMISRDTVRTLGEVFQKGKKSYLNQYFPSGLNPLSSYFEASHLLQYNLVGDPATHIQMANKPDFHLDSQSMSITPLTPVPGDGFINLKLRILNYGLTSSDSIKVDINHTQPGNIVHNYTRKIPKLRADTTLTFQIPINETMVGDNQFQAIVDTPNLYVETNELDNTTTKTQVIYSKGLTIVTPFNYGVATSVNPMLRVALSTPDANNRVIFELDTLETFSSPFKKTGTVASATSGADWIPPVSLEQGKTYYWRTRLNEASQVNNWKNSIFTVRTDLSDGWYQQGDLFDDNMHHDITYSANNRWTLPTYNVGVRVNAGFYGASKNQFVVNGELYQRNGRGFSMLILDGKTGVIKAHQSTLPCGGPFVSANNTPWPLFKQTIENAATGDYMIFRTRHLCENLSIPDSIKQYFKNLGSTAIDTMQYDVKPWAFFTRKNMIAGHTKDFDAKTLDPTNADYSKDTTFTFNEPFGATESPLFGPAMVWQNLRWESDISPSETSQSIVLDVLDANGNVLIAGIAAADLPANLSSIDAALHPNIRLRATLQDASQTETPQLLNWHVGYQPVPEIAMDFLNLSAHTVQEGQSLNTTLQIYNLSKHQTGALKVNYFLTNSANQTTLIHTEDVANLAASEAKEITKTISTLNIVGNNILTAVVTQVGQNEAVTYNNQIVKTFTVTRDSRVPEFMVTVDGLSLPNDPNPIVNPNSAIYPFVSANPKIEIVLDDDSPFLLLDDPSLFTLTFNGQVVPLSRNDVQFIPGTAPDNSAKIIFSPNLTQASGTYTLTFAAKDVTGNAIGTYQAHFRVQNEFSIDNLYPYPNPMVNQTEFVFNMRGANVSSVESFGIKVYTLSGKLVKVFDLLAPNTLVVPLKIGWNKLRWNGTDEDGDPLATGTYLYKIHFKAGGKEVAVNNENSIEKLVIIR